MLIDVVKPNHNETEFVNMAKILGYNALVFIYENPTEMKNNFKTFPEITVYPALLSSNTSFKGILSFSSSNNRKLIEKGKIDILFNQEIYHKKDSMHFRYSGLNHVYAKMLAQKDILYAISLSTILGFENRAQLLGKIMQNIKLCEKFNAKISIFSFAHNPLEMRAPKDLVGVLAVLGANTTTQKNNFLNLANKIQDKQQKLVIKST